MTLLESTLDVLDELKDLTVVFCVNIYKLHCSRCKAAAALKHVSVALLGRYTMLQSEHSGFVSAVVTTAKFDLPRSINEQLIVTTFTLTKMQHTWPKLTIFHLGSTDTARSLTVVLPQHYLASSCR
jgi:hypothetical protein